MEGQNEPGRITIHRFVPVARAMDYVRLGWLPLPTFAGTHHENYKVHLTWLCSCDVKEPDPLRVVREKKRMIIHALRQRQFQYN